MAYVLTGINCATCHAPILRDTAGVGAGYGEDHDGKRHCYACCAKRTLADMMATGRATLYHVKRDGKSYVTDWPGMLEFPAQSWKINHNFSRYAEAVEFHGPDGFIWSGRNIGDMQCFNARRTKRRWRMPDAALAKLAEWRKLADDAGYRYDDYGMIRSPGKFEGEHISALAFYEAWMDSTCDEDARGFPFLALDDVERWALRTKARRAYMHEDGNGFFYVVLR